MQENLNAIRVVKSFVREDREQEKFAQRSDTLRDTAERAYSFVVLFVPLVTLIMGGTIMAIMWLGGHYVVGGAMLSGDLIAFFTYASEILMSLMMVAMVMMVLTRSIACGKRIVEVLEEQPEITDSAADPALTVENGEVDFDHVYFKYHKDSGAWNLEDICLHIKSGMTVGILGGTGSAKSTLVSLIPRLYEATEGAVSVGGHDVREYTMEALRQGCAMVLQKNTLFSGTIRENLRWGREDATDAEMEEACRMACADEFISRMPDGYDTHIEQGGAVHRPGHSPASPGADSGRLHLRRGHRHRRKDPVRPAPGPARGHQAHHRPAHFLRHGRRPDRGAGRRQNFRCRHP